MTTIQLYKKVLEKSGPERNAITNFYTAFKIYCKKHGNIVDVMNNIEYFRIKRNYYAQNNYCKN